MTHIEHIYTLSEGGESNSYVCNYCRQMMNGTPHEIFHMDDHIKIMYVVSGGMEWSVNHLHYHVESGDFIIVNNTEMRKIDTIQPPGNLVFDWIQFTPMTVYPNVSLSAHLKSVDFARICSIFFHRPEGFSHLIRADSPFYKNILFYYESIRSSATGHDILRDEAIVTNLRALVIEITRHYSSVLSTDSFLYENGIEHDMEVLTEAISYVRSHYTENISESEVAQRIFVSTSCLSRVFNKCIGISFRSYLRQLRLEKTLALLKEDPSLTAIEAAFSCGFNSASGFYKTLGDICGKGGMRLLQQKTRLTDIK